MYNETNNPMRKTPDSTEQEASRPRAPRRSAVGNTARTLMLLLGTAGAAGAVAQEAAPALAAASLPDSDPATDAQERGEAPREEAGAPRDESGWMELAEADPRSVICAFPQYHLAPYAQRVLARAAELAPETMVREYETYRERLEARVLFLRAAEELLASPEGELRYRVVPLMDALGTLGTMGDEGRRIAERAALAAAPDAALRKVDQLAAVLSPGALGRVLQEVLRGASPLAVLFDAGALAGRVAGAEAYVAEAARAQAHRDPMALIVNLASVHRALPEPLFGEVVTTIVEEDPVLALRWLGPDDETAGETSRLLRRYAPALYVSILDAIRTADTDPGTKDVLARLLDQFVYDRHLTVPEAIAVAQDSAALERVLAEIRERPRHIGGQALTPPPAGEAGEGM